MSSTDTSVALDLSRVHFPVTTLGPGRRIGIWFQGCSIRCPGCISADTWAVSKAPTTVTDVIDAVRPWLSQADGITISGGEPFDQVSALEILLRNLRSESTVDVLDFSGHSLEALSNLLARMRGLFDAIVTDPFEHTTAQTLRLRGSDNQRLTFLTPLGRSRFSPFQRPLEEGDRNLDVCFDETGRSGLRASPIADDFAEPKRITPFTRPSCVNIGGQELSLAPTVVYGGVLSCLTARDLSELYHARMCRRRTDALADLFRGDRTVHADGHRGSIPGRKAAPPASPADASFAITAIRSPMVICCVRPAAATLRRRGAESTARRFLPTRAAGGGAAEIEAPEIRRWLAGLDRRLTAEGAARELFVAARFRMSNRACSRFTPTATSRIRRSTSSSNGNRATMCPNC